MFEFLEHIPTWVIVVAMIVVAAVTWALSAAIGARLGDAIALKLALRGIDVTALFDFAKLSKRRRGAWAERMVNRALEDLDPDEYVARFKNVWLPAEDGEMTEIDHIVVSVYGIFVIETKYATGDIYGREEEPEWTLKRRDGSTITDYPNPTRQNYKHWKVLAKALGIYESNVFPLVVFLGYCEIKKPLDHAVKGVSNLLDFIRSKRTPVFNRNEALRQALAIKDACLSPTREEKRAHARRIQKRKEREEQEEYWRDRDREQREQQERAGDA